MVPLDLSTISSTDLCLMGAMVLELSHPAQLVSTSPLVLSVWEV